MPESPEIAFQKHYIDKNVRNYVLHDIDILWGRYKKHGPPLNFVQFKRQLPLKCVEVQKKGKVLFIYFERDWCLISKLGMSGWWYVTCDEPKWKPVTKNVVMHFRGEDDKDLIFSDYRNFGTLQFTQDKQVIQREMSALAPDILDKDIKFQDVMKNINGLSTAKQEWLLEDALIDQKMIVSGIGNYLKSEVLYDARISPLRKVKDVTAQEWRTIFGSAKRICQMMYRILLKMRPELYIGAMKVYHKDKDPLGNDIKQHKTKSGRTTFWVPILQV